MILGWFGFVCGLPQIAKACVDCQFQHNLINNFVILNLWQPNYVRYPKCVLQFPEQVLIGIRISAYISNRFHQNCRCQAGSKQTFPTELPRTIDDMSQLSDGKASISTSRTSTADTIPINLVINNGRKIFSIVIDRRLEDASANTRKLPANFTFRIRRTYGRWKAIRKSNFIFWRKPSQSCWSNSRLRLDSNLIGISRKSLLVNRSL